MGLNNLGLGFVFTAKDLAGKTVTGLERKFDKLEGTTDKAGIRTKQGFQQIGVGLAAVAVGAKGLSALFGTVTDAREYGKAIAEVATLTDEATFPTATMKQLTQDLAAQFGMDAMQQAPALYQAISAGATSVGAATEIMNSANKLAIGGVTDLTTSVDVLTSAVNVFSSEGLDAADAADTLFVTIKAGKTTAGELGGALGRVLPIAKSVGVNFQQVNAAIAATTANGLQTRRAVTGMNAALANVIKPSKDATKEAKRLGIEFNQGALRAKGMKKFLDQITGSSKFNADSMSKLFTSVEGLNFIQSLTMEDGKKFNEVLKQMETRGGAADAAFKTMNGTLDQQIKRYEALKKNIKITIGEALAPLVGVMVTVLTAMVKGFQALPKPLQKVFIGVTAVVSALVLFAGIAVAVRGAAMLMGNAFIQMALKMAPMLIPFIKFIAIAALVIGAMVLLKKMYDSNIGGFGDAVRDAWADIKPALIELKEAIVSAGRTVLDALRPLFPVFKIIGKVLIKTVVFQIKIFAFWIRVIAKGFSFLVRGVLAGVRFLIAGWRAWWEAVKLVWGFIIDGARTIWGWLREKLEPAVDAVSDVFVDLASVVKSAWAVVASVINPVIDAISRAIDWMMDKINDVVEAVKFAKGFVDFLTGDDAESGEMIITNPDGSETKISNPEALSPQERQRLGIGPGAGGGGRQPTNFAAAAAPAGGSRGGGKTEVKSTVQANIKLEVDGQEIAKVVRKIEAENQTRGSR